jgi:hypothetical protein
MAGYDEIRWRNPGVDRRRRPKSAVIPIENSDQIETHGLGGSSFVTLISSFPSFSDIGVLVDSRW